MTVAPPASSALRYCHMRNEPRRFSRAYCSRGGRFGTHSSNESFTPVYYGRVMFFAHFNAGVRAVDIRNPYSPKEIGYYIPAITDRTAQRCVERDGNRLRMKVGRTTVNARNPPQNLHKLLAGIDATKPDFRHAAHVAAPLPSPMDGDRTIEFSDDTLVDMGAPDGDGPFGEVDNICLPNCDNTPCRTGYNCYNYGANGACFPVYADGGGSIMVSAGCWPRAPSIHTRPTAPKRYGNTTAAASSPVGGLADNSYFPSNGHIWRIDYDGGDRISSASATATGPIAALTSMLFDAGFQLDRVTARREARLEVLRAFPSAAGPEFSPSCVARTACGNSWPSTRYPCRP